MRPGSGRPDYHTARPSVVREGVCCGARAPGRTFRCFANSVEWPPPRMTTGSSASIPAHTVLGLRAQTERLGFQEFHLVLMNTDGVGKSFPITDSSLKIGK